MQRGKDYTGQRFGRLVVLKESHKHRGHRYWHVECDCGARRVVRQLSFTSGRSKSCGCLSAELATERATRRLTTHGMSGTPTYNSWCSMKNRCENPNTPQYAEYGGRGISVYPPWSASFEAFHAALGTRPEGTSLDRIDVNGNYEPGNVRWADAYAQANNVRRNHRFTVRGETHTLSEWARIKGVAYDLLRSRILRYGWHPTVAIETPAGEPNILA